MFSGSITAMITPLKTDGSLDLQALERLVEFQIENGTDALLPCGTTGEAAALTHDEKILVAKRTIEIAAGRIPVIVGAGSNDTAAAVEMTRDVQKIGATGALSVAPYYNKPMQEGLYQHFSAVAGVGLPIIMYNVPGRAGVSIAPETIIRLSKLPNIAAVKDATGNVDNMMAVLREAPDFEILCGDDALTFSMMALGAKGVISVASNIMPRAVSDLAGLLAGGNYNDARKLHYKLLPVFKVLFCETNPIPVKESLAMMGMIRSTMRLPMTPIGAGNKEKLASVLREAGVIK
ncbi:MAG: 4-hydroxy-tetrahydrodipicolinate synthase [Rickettsiales bacterium]|jgi:4-hydroxy-tetrahydrodipicolinate synthase|nr:4-hydroxy-tetrahydrodipicolinate synthase [Rickettsiales bacterium]